MMMGMGMMNPMMMNMGNMGGNMMNPMMMNMGMGMNPMMMAGGGPNNAAQGNGAVSSNSNSNNKRASGVGVGGGGGSKTGVGAAPSSSRKPSVTASAPHSAGDADAAMHQQQQHAQQQQQHQVNTAHTLRVDQLKNDMQGLTGDDLPGLVSTLQRYDPSWQPTDGNISLDLNALDVVVIDALECYVAKCRQKRTIAQQQQSSVFRSPHYDASASRLAGLHGTPVGVGVGLGAIASPGSMGVSGGAPPSDSDSDSD